MGGMVPPSASALRGRLAKLHAERAQAALSGVTGDIAYMADLEDEIEETAHDYVLAAVTEIATLLAELSGAQVG
jgi:hypothetical protein